MDLKQKFNDQEKDPKSMFSFLSCCSNLSWSLLEIVAALTLIFHNQFWSRCDSFYDEYVDHYSFSR